MPHLNISRTMTQFVVFLSTCGRSSVSSGTFLSTPFRFASHHNVRFCTIWFTETVINNKKSPVMLTPHLCLLHPSGFSIQYLRHIRATHFPSLLSIQLAVVFDLNTPVIFYVEYYAPTYFFFHSRATFTLFNPILSTFCFRISPLHIT
jgi:hypothetical protein